MGQCQVDEFTKKLTVELPDTTNAELLLPLGKSHEDAILEFVITNGISDSYIPEIRDFVKKSIGPDVQSITLRKFLKINATGVVSKINGFFANLTDFKLSESDINSYKVECIKQLSLLEDSMLFPGTYRMPYFSD